MLSPFILHSFHGILIRSLTQEAAFGLSGGCFLRLGKFAFRFKDLSMIDFELFIFTTDNSKIKLMFVAHQINIENKNSIVASLFVFLWAELRRLLATQGITSRNCERVTIIAWIQKALHA